MKIKIFAVVILAVIAGVVVLIRSQGQAVDAVHPKIEKAVQAVYATGTVEAVQMIPISPKISARLMELKVDEGKRVQKGEILAQLEDIDTQQTLAELDAQLLVAEKDLARAQTLARTGAIAKSTLEQSQASFDSAKAAVARTKAELSYLQLLAPEDGTIIRRDGEIGEMMVANTPVFWMIGGDRMRIETEVDEEDISLVQPDQRVVISADAFPGQVFEGVVQSITPKGDPVARSYRVRVGFANPAPLLIGMTAETNIITQEKERALMIPLSAVSDGRVMVLDKNGKIQITPIKTGIKTAKTIEILSGVQDDATIVQKFDAALADQTKVKGTIKDWSAAPDTKSP